MKLTKTIFSLVVIALGISLSGSALAFHHGGHVRFGVFVGGPAFWYYPPPYYYPPYYPPVVQPAAPPVYVEQGSAQSAPAPSQGNWWYYCAAAKAYYPYVKECPAGWQRVAPQPQS
jgi:hypothetical protein